jgi:hypothetical protein
MRFTSCAPDTLEQEVTYPSITDATNDLNTAQSTFPFEKFVVMNKDDLQNLSVMQMIDFVTEQQELSFMEKFITLSADFQTSPEYLSALYILSGNPSLYEKTHSYFSNDGFKIVKLLEEVDLSSGEYILISLASNLFNGNTKVTPLDLVGMTGDLNFQIAIKAIQGRRMWGK